MFSMSGHSIVAGDGGGDASDEQTIRRQGINDRPNLGAHLSDSERQQHHDAKSANDGPLRIHLTVRYTQRHARLFR